MHEQTPSFQIRKDKYVLEEAGSEDIRRLLEGLNCMVSKGAVVTTVKTGDIDNKKEEHALFEVQSLRKNESTDPVREQQYSDLDTQ